ncbi:hypothetical protein BDY24DRAFT_381014 [Mrakia frigida]|uniref:bZIP transcription factor n=1 Tax=Mrakia frigida TaxID=29902 RepID=UPI003FCBF04F
MSVPDWFAVIQTATAAEQAEQSASQDHQAQQALSQALASSGYAPPQQQQQSIEQGSGHNGFLEQQQLDGNILDAHYAGSQPQWMDSVRGFDSFAQENQSQHLQQPPLSHLAYELNNGSSLNANPQTQASASNPVGLVSPYPDHYNTNPSSSSSSNFNGPSGPPHPPSPAAPTTVPSPSKRPRRASSTTGPTPSPQTKRRKSDTLKSGSVPLNQSAEELKLDQAISSLKSNVPALRAFFHILPIPDSTPSGLVDGVLPPNVDDGQSTVVSTSASYVHALQKERDAGRRMIAGLEGVLKATGGEEMLDAWKAQLAVAEEERAEAEALLDVLASQNVANLNRKGKEVDRSVVPNPSPSSLALNHQTSNDPSSSSISTSPNTSSLQPKVEPPIRPLLSCSPSYTINPSSIDSLKPNYYDPTTYDIESHDFMTYPSGDPVVASGKGEIKSKQEIAREKNREKQRRFRERQKAKLTELEAKLKELHKGSEENEMERGGEEEEEEDELEPALVLQMGMGETEGGGGPKVV